MKIPIFVIGIFALGVVIGISVIKATNDNAYILNDASPTHNTLYVGGSGPNNYTTIQSAINDANDGDTIFVYSGVYYENIIINKRITLIGEDKETTIIDGNYTGDVVKITANGVSIKGFTIRKSGVWPYAGIKIYCASNNSIYNCNISNNNRGIHAYYSSNNSIYNCNIISNGWVGIWLDYSNNNSIYSCYINNEDGIYTYYSSNNEIYNCNISNNHYGIYTYYSSNNEIYNCNISNNHYGIYTYYSSNNEIYNCNFINDGIAIDGNESSHLIHDIHNNTVNGKPLLYYKNAHNVILDGIEAGQIILANCSNFKIKNMEISNTDVGIEIALSNDINIYNCNISNNWHGIWLLYSSNNEIYNCNIVSNTWVGILLEYSSNNSIYNCNIISNGGSGISLGDSYYNEIYNCNIVSNCWRGISLWDSYYNEIYNCNIVNTNYDYGISLSNSHYNEIYNCNITRNNEAGIELSYSSNNKIYNCNISNNWHGIYVYYSSNNSIYNCNMSDNDNGWFEWYSSNNSIYNCNISNNHCGIYAYYSSNNSIYNCNISDNYRGIYAYYSSNNSIYNCNIIGNDWRAFELNKSSNNEIYNCNISDDSIYLSYSSNNSIYNCNMSNGHNGIYLSYSSNNSIYNCNMSNGYHIIWLDFSSNNEIYNCNICNGVICLSYSSNNSIYNCNISNGWCGIGLDNSSKNEIYNCYIISNFWYGIKLDNSSNNSIYKCYISNNNRGIYAFYSSNNSIYNCNIISNGWYSIELDNSSKNEIYNCNISNNYDGIRLEYSSNNEIYNCNIISNNCDGIGLYYSNNNSIYNCNISNNDDGIYANYSSNNSIYNCNIISNTWVGILLEYSSNNPIYNCNIISNGWWDGGIELDNSSNNEIHYCNIYNNDDYGVYNYNSESEYIVNASYNWWGSADGPSGAGPGSGDAVSSNVIYEPWLTEPWGGVNPILYVHPTSHDFGNMDVGEEADWNFYIENKGEGTLSWSISESIPWASVSSTSGTTTTEIDEITVHVDTSGLEAGKHYDGYIYITSNGGNEEVYIEVNVTGEAEYNPIIYIPPNAPKTISSTDQINLTYIVEVKNGGNAEDVIELSAYVTSPHLQVYLSDTQFTLSPSQIKRVYVNVSVKKAVTGDIYIYAKSQKDSTKIDTAKLGYDETLDLCNPLYVRYVFDGTANIDIDAPEYAKFIMNEPDDSQLIEIVFDPNSTQANLREFYINVTDKETGDTLKLPIRLEGDWEIISTDFDISKDGYNFKNWGMLQNIPILNIFLNGFCFGMSETSILYYNFKKGLFPFEIPPKIPFENTYSLPKEIAQYKIYLHQNRLSNLIAGFYATFLANPQKEIEKIKQDISDGYPTMLLMRLKQDDKKVGHAVVAYKFIRKGDDAYIIFYDPNCPYEGNNLLSLEYALLKYELTTSSYDCLFYPDQIIKFARWQAMSLLPPLNGFIFACPVNITIKDEFGRKITGDGVNEILNANCIIINESKIFLLPNNLSYSLEISAYDYGNFSFIAIFSQNDSSIINSFDKISLQPETKIYSTIPKNAETVNLSIDYNGDGLVDEKMTPIETLEFSFPFPKCVLTISVEPSNAGYVELNPPGGIYDYGTVVNVTAIAKEGYKFSHWSGDVYSSNQTIQITMDSNKSIVAHFEIIQYTLTTSIEPSGSGNVSLNPPGGIYDYGTVVNVTAIAKEGYKFSHWSGDVYSSNQTIQITMDSNKSIVAHFITINHPPMMPRSPHPVNGETNVAITTTLTWQCGDIDNDTITYDVYFGTSLNPPKVASNITSNSYNPGMLQYSTTYYWRIVAWDEHKAKNSSETWHFTTEEYTPPPPPNHPPTVTIIYPSNGATVSGAITIQGKASDEDGNETIQKVEIKIDGNWIAANGTTSWQYEWNTSQVENGWHTIEARAYDGELYSDIVSIKVNVFNNHKPFIEIIEPANGSIVKGSIVIKGKAWDIDGNETIQKVEIRIDGEEWINVSGTINWNHTLDTTKLSDGLHVIEARCCDGIDYSNITIQIEVRNKKKGIAGFELFVFIVAIIIALRKRKAS